MNTSRRIASHLLAVDSRQGSADQGKIRTHPVLFAFLNLLFCGYMDHFLQGDIYGHYLALFLFIQCSMLTLIAVGTFIRGHDEILFKTKVFPTTQLSRLLFVLRGFLQKPASIALWLTTMLFVIVFYYRTPVVMGLSIVAVAMMVVNLELMIAVVCLRLHRSSRSVAGVAVISVLTMFGVLVATIVFQFHSLLAAAPLISWTVDIILAAQQSHVNIIAAYGLLMVVALAVLIWIGKRLA